MTEELTVDPASTDGAQPRRQILVLHGGGYRGLYTARVLELLEKDLDAPIIDSFDMVAGTSIGGIIALALADGVPAKDIRQTIESKGPTLFPAYGWFGRKAQFVKRLFVPPHRQERLAGLVQAVLDKDKTLDELDIEVVVPACDATGGPDGPAAVLFGNHEQQERRSSTLLDAALATSAAPTYFASYQTPESQSQLVDGGVIANSPSWIALTVALAEYGWSIDRLRMLIIGTTKSAAGRTPPPAGTPTWRQRIRHPIKTYRESHSEGLLYWLRKGRLLSLLMDGQQRLADDMCKEAMFPGYCVSINSFRSREHDTVAAALDQASDRATAALLSLAEAERKERSPETQKALMQILRHRAVRTRTS